MKRFVLLILAVFMLLSFAACDNGNTASSTDLSATEQSEEYKQAVSLIEEGKIKESYLLLRSLKDDKGAQELLKDFEVVYSKQSITRMDGTTTAEEYKYDDKGNLETKTEISQFGTKVVTNYIYENDRLISTVRTGNEKYIEKYTYDDKGLLVKRTGPDVGDGEFVFEYFYDANRNIIKTVRTSAVGTLTREYTYNLDNKLVKEIYTASYGTTLETEYIYDGNALVKKIETSKNDKSAASSKTVHEYTNNADGNPVKCVSTSTLDGIETQYETDYSYDADGNLIKTEESDDSYGIYRTTEYSGYLYFYHPEK